MLTFKQFLTLSENNLPIIELVEFSAGKHITDLKKIIKISDSNHGQNADKLHSKLVKHYNKYDRHHIKAIEKYTNINGSFKLNKHLVQQHLKGDKSIAKVHQNHVKNLDSAVKKHKTPHDMHVYTGLRYHPDKVAKTTKDGHKHVVSPGYTSTSLSHEKAEMHARFNAPTVKGKVHTHALKIHVPKGHHGAYVDHHAITDGQKEFILPRHTKLKIHHTPEIHETKTDVHHIWHAKIVK